MNKLKYFLIVLILSLLTAILIGGIVYLISDSKLNTYKQEFQTDLDQLKDRVQELENEHTNDNTSDASQNSDANYVNDIYGFSLNFPESWNGYLAKTNEYDTYDLICFYFDNQEQPFCILQIIVYTPEQLISATILEGSILDENQEYTFVSDYDMEGTCVQFNEFQCDRSNEVADILTTFKIL